MGAHPEPARAVTRIASPVSVMINLFIGKPPLGGSHDLNKA
jgi:hypothetical protein